MGRLRLNRRRRSPRSTPEAPAPKRHPLFPMRQIPRLPVHARRRVEPSASTPSWVAPPVNPPAMCRAACTPPHGPARRRRPPTCPAEPSIERAALPVGDPPAGALDHRHQRHEVVGLRGWSRRPGRQSPWPAGRRHSSRRRTSAAGPLACTRAKPRPRRRRGTWSGLVANSTASSSRGQARTRIGRPFNTDGRAGDADPALAQDRLVDDAEHRACRDAPARSACRTAAGR